MHSASLRVVACEAQRMQPPTQQQGQDTQRPLHTARVKQSAPVNKLEEALWCCAACVAPIDGPCGRVTSAKTPTGSACPAVAAADETTVDPTKEGAEEAATAAAAGAVEG